MKIIAFQHFMKTGGTSIRNALLRSRSDFNLLMSYVGNDDPKFSFKDTSQLRAACIEGRTNVVYGHHVVLPHWMDHDMAMFFRDPFDRFCSHAMWVYRQGQNPHDVPFKDALEYFLSTHQQHKHYREILVNPLELSYVGLMEHFEESLELFKKMYGIELEVRRDNSFGSVKDYRIMAHDCGLYELICHACREDYEIYLQALKKFKSLIRSH